MFPSDTTSLELNGPAHVPRGPVDVGSLRDEGAELPSDFVPQQPAIIPWGDVESLVRNSAPGILTSDVCDGGLK